jgi:hypothetical protein
MRENLGGNATSTPRKINNLRHMAGSKARIPLSPSLKYYLCDWELRLRAGRQHSPNASPDLFIRALEGAYSRAWRPRC